MLILALDSSATASVALARLDSENRGSTATILAARESADTRSHAEVMSPFVAQVLDEAQVDGQNVDAILTGTGPGPFTGLRAGIVTARTLGFAWNKPVYGLMSLTALAERAFVQDFQGKAAQKTEILVASDARRREIYSAIFTVTENGYTIKPVRRWHPQAKVRLHPAAFLDRIPQVIVPTVTVPSFTANSWNSWECKFLPSYRSCTPTQATSCAPPRAWA